MGASSAFLALAASVLAGDPESPAETSGFRVEAGTRGSYIVFGPPIRSDEPARPVILFLNGKGENGDDGLRHISRNFGPQIWEMRRYFPCIGVAVQCRRGASWSADSDDTRRALAALDEVIEKYGGDPDRVILTGCSAGGSGAWSIASRHPERFAAVVPLCGSRGGDAKALARARLPIWCFYNDGDDPGLVAYNRKIREELFEQGVSPVITEYHRKGHRCWDWAYVTPALFAWCLEQDRSKHREIRRFRWLRTDELLDKWERHGSAAWEPGDEGELRCMSEGNRGQGWCVSPDAQLEWEVHCDVLLEDDADCRVALLSGSGNEPDVSQGAVLVIADPENGSGGLTDHHGRWLATLDPVGQQHLIRGRWNDIRLRYVDGQLSVRINGWSSLEYETEELRAGPVRFALCSSPTGLVSYRYVRVAETETK